MGSIPNGFIQTGQGFFVRALEFGSAKFTNAHRVNASASTQFYRTSNETSSNNSEVHRIRLNLNDANK